MRARNEVIMFCHMYSLVSRTHTAWFFSMACKQYDTQVHMAIAGEGGVGGQCRQRDTGYCGYESSAAAVSKVEQSSSAGRLTTHRVTLLAHVCKTERTQTQLLVAAREAHQRNTETLHRGPPHHHHHHLELWLCILRNSMRNVFAATYNQGESLGTKLLLAAQKFSLKLKWVFLLRKL